MALNIQLPSKKQLREIERNKYQVPVDQIIKTLGNNPLAQGIDTGIEDFTNALQKRYELQQRVLGKKAIESAYGLQPDTLKDVPYEVAPTVGANIFKEKESKQSKQKVFYSIDEKTGVPIDIITKQPILQLSPDVDYTRAEKSDYEDRTNTQREIQFINRLYRQKDRMIADPRIKPLYDKQISIGNIEKITQKALEGNTIAAASLGAEMAKAIEGGGRLTDQDVVRYVNSGRLDRKAADTWKKWVTGTPTETTLGEILQIADVLKERYAEKVQPIYNEYIESFANTEGITPDEVSRKMAIPYIPTQLLPPPGETKDQRKARLLAELAGAK